MTASATRLALPVLVAASIGWPVLLASAMHADAPGWQAIVYVAASRVCHQKPERSFHTDGRQWPVCARCSGLYLAAPIGAVLAATGLGRTRRWRHPARLLAVTAVPTAATLGLEWLGLAPVGNTTRFLAALPLGAAAALVIGDLLGDRFGGRRESIGYTRRP